MISLMFMFINDRMSMRERLRLGNWIVDTVSMPSA